MARDYKKLQIYHLSYAFTKSVYNVLNQIPKFEENNLYSQLRRASVSIPLNIAEGSSKASINEFLYFLNTAWASGKEVEVILQLCNDFSYIDKKTFDKLSKNLDELNAKLFLFMRNIEERTSKRKKFFRKFEEQK